MKKAWDFLGSRDLSVFIFIMGITYTLFLVIFGIFVSVPWVGNISRLLPFKVLYLLFFVNLIICEIKWIPVIIHRCRMTKVPEKIEDIRKFRHRVEVNAEDQGLRPKIKDLERYLRWRGYKVHTEDLRIETENAELKTEDAKLMLYAYKGRFSPVGNLLFHFSFLVLLIGAGTSSLFRFSGTARVPEGFDFMGSIREYTSFVPSLLSPLPSLSFTLDKIEPKFWDGKLLFTDLKADIAYNGDMGSAWMSSPLRIGGTRVTINSVGITPMYLLKNKDGKELDSGYVNLAVFAPGTEDHFQIPGYPHRIFVSFYPDYEIRDGIHVTRSMELKNPVYFIKVFRGRILVYSGVLKSDEDAVFDSLRLSFPEIRYWGELRIIKDPGFLFIWISFVLFSAGLVLRLIFYKREIVLVMEKGSLCLYAASDFYHTLFEDHVKILARIIDEK